MRSLFQNKPKSFVRLCYVYLPLKESKAFVAATYNHGGLFAEQPDGVLSLSTSDTIELGRAVKQQLSQCAHQSEFNYSNRKRTDWPAFKKSSVRSVSLFEKSFLCYVVGGANEANIYWEVTSPKLPNQIELRSTLSSSASDVELGDSIIVLHEFYIKVCNATQ